LGEGVWFADGKWSSLLSYLAMAPHLLMVLVVGFLSGMELPLLLRLAEIHQIRRLVTRLLAIDYLASFLGALSFPLWMFPALGMVRSGALLAMLNIVALLLTVPLNLRLKPMPRRPLAVAALAVMALLTLILSEPLTGWLSRALYQ
jgi:predicted membrane-bound spermidine synthase